MFYDDNYNNHRQNLKMFISLVMEDLKLTGKANDSPEITTKFRYSCSVNVY